MMEQKKTILHSWHQEHKAKLVDFAGWEMPVQYANGMRNEHLLVRQSCGLFDISHMGRFLINCKSPQACEEYERVISSPVWNVPVKFGSYGLLCKEDGGIIDDIFHFRLDESCFLLVVNAANSEKDFQWIQDHCPSIELTDISADTGMIALQGPKALSLLSKSNFSLKCAELSGRNSVSAGDILIDGICTQTGYTGEDGVEIYAPTEQIPKIWNMLLHTAEQNTIACGPIGLGARDSLRFEPGYPLYGHELSEDLTPWEARLKWACKLDDTQADFIGKTAIQKKYADKADGNRLYTLQLVDPAMPRQGMDVVNASGDKIGWVCSGIASPTLEGFYANAYIRQSVVSSGEDLFIEVRSKKKAVNIVKRPIYRGI